LYLISNTIRELNWRHTDTNNKYANSHRENREKRIPYIYV